MRYESLVYHTDHWLSLDLIEEVMLPSLASELLHL
jgi:hypothetical protein